MSANSKDAYIKCSSELVENAVGRKVPLVANNKEQVPFAGVDAEVTKNLCNT